MFRYSEKSLFLIILVTSILLSACNTSGSDTASSPGKPESAQSEESNAAEKVSVAENPAQDDPENAAEVLASFNPETGNSEMALAALEGAGVQSMDSESRLVYAVLLRSEGRLDESRAELETIVKENPEMAEAWYNLALVEHAAGNKQSRDSALDSAISADGNYAEAFAFRGNLAIADSDWNRAETNLKRALELEPESAESLTGMAWVMAKTERIEEALGLLDLAVGIDPDFIYARVDRSRVNVALRNYNDAERDLDYVIAKEQDNPWHYLDRARIRLRHFKDYPGALEDLENVERLDPDNFFALVYLAGLHDEERRFTTAKAYYQRVVELRSDYIWAYMPLGKYAWMEGAFGDAAKWYLKAAAQDSEDFSLSLMAALSMYRSGNVSEADKLFSETLRMFEPGESAYEVIRFCVERNSDYYAVNALNKESNETLRERLWFYLGAVYESENNDVGASAVFERLAVRTGEMEYDLAWAALNGMEN